MKDGGKEFGARSRCGATTGQPEGQIRLLEEALEPARRPGRGRLGPRGRGPGHRRQDARASEGRARSSSRSTPTRAEPPTPAAPTSARTTARRARPPARPPPRSGPRGARSAVFVGTASAANARERREGFFAGGRAEVHSRSRSSRTAATTSRARVERPDRHQQVPRPRRPARPLVVQRRPDRRGGRQVARASARRSTVVTFDLDEPAVEHLEKGKIDATVCQNPYEMGYQGVRLLKALIEKDDEDRQGDAPRRQDRVDTGVRVIVPEGDSPGDKEATTSSTSRR